MKVESNAVVTLGVRADVTMAEGVMVIENVTIRGSAAGFEFLPAEVRDACRAALVRDAKALDVEMRLGVGEGAL